WSGVGAPPRAYAVGTMTGEAQDHVALARWQRMLLPGELRGVDGRRSVRDWVVDVLMYLVAAAISGLVLVTTWDDHGSAALVVDFVIGAATYVALWWRRSHPVAVGVATGIASIVSAAASGPALPALLHAARRAE